MTILKRLLTSLSVLTLSASSFATGGISSNGPIGPDEMLIREFIQNPAVQAAANQLLAQGYRQVVPKPTSMILSGTCVPVTPSGYAGRCVTQFLVSVAFLNPSSTTGEYRTVSATIVTDNYDHVPGTQSKARFKVLPEPMIEMMARTLNK